MSQASQLMFWGIGQGCFTYRHGQVLYCIASNLSGLLAESQTIHVCADLPGMYTNVSPQACNHPSITYCNALYHPDIVITMNLIY